MATKGKASEVGESSATDKSKKDVSDLVNDVLGAPADVPKSTLPKEEPDAGLDSEETEEPVQQEEGSEEEGLESEGSEADGETEGEEESDEVVPASKHKKALEKMQDRIDALNNKIKEQESKEKTSPKTQDEKLAHLSIQELQELRDNVDDSIIDAKVAAKTEGVDATARVTELRELRRSIEKEFQLKPQRFQGKQLQHLQAMAEEVKELDPEVVNRRGELWKTAARVFQRMPSLQRSETGQAEALAIASEYFLERKGLELGQERTTTLSKKVTNLKRKTSLDSKVRQADATQVSSKKLRDKARNGTLDDKQAFIKTLIPDDFIQSQ